MFNIFPFRLPSNPCYYPPLVMLLVHLIGHHSGHHICVNIWCFVILWSWMGSQTQLQNGMAWNLCKPNTSDYVATCTLSSQKNGPIFVEVPHVWLRCRRRLLLPRKMAHWILAWLTSGSGSGHIQFVIPWDILLYMQPTPCENNDSRT